MCGEKPKTMTQFGIWERKKEKGRERYEDAVRQCPHEHSEVVGIQIECFVWEMLVEK